MHVDDFTPLVRLTAADLYACPLCGAAVADLDATHEIDSQRMRHIYWHARNDTEE